MPQIVVTYDTDSKQIRVSMDGQDIPNVRTVHFDRYQDWDNPGVYKGTCTIEAWDKDENNILKVSHIYASESSDKLRQDIMNYFSR